MKTVSRRPPSELAQRLAEAEATIQALLAGQIDAVVDVTTSTPVLLSKAQEALRQSEEQYRQIVEATSDGIVKVDSAALIVYVNCRFAEMVGYEARELIGKRVSSLASGQAMEDTESNPRERRLRTRGAVDLVLRHKDGSAIAANISHAPLFDADGQHVGNLAVVRDVTERNKLQSQLIVSDRMASVGTLAAGVAHEVNNPLAAVLANLGHIAERLRAVPAAVLQIDQSKAWFQEGIQGPLDDALEGARRVQLIVRDLKVFSRSSDEEARGPVDVTTVMESSSRMAWNEIRHRARFIKDYGPVPNAEVNEARLGQVFLNLLVNAAQSLPEGRAEHNEIRVSTRLEAQRIVVLVTDTGAGIPPEIIGRIFDPFFTTKAPGVGTGLGLAICQRIVTDMGGALTVESEVGRGTTFRVVLPQAVRVASLPPALVEEARVVVRRARILVVDDEELLVRAVQRVLGSEHDIVATVVAQDALALCANGEKFDLVLCDLMMPVMTGMDLHRELLLLSPDQASKMVFMTGGAFTAKAREFMSATTLAHIEKPFESRALRATVRRLLRASSDVAFPTREIVTKDALGS